MVLLGCTVVFQVVEGLFTFISTSAFFSSCWFATFHTMKEIRSLTENGMLLDIYCFNVLSNLYLCICLVFTRVTPVGLQKHLEPVPNCTYTG